MATFACIMQKSANGTNVSLGSGPRSAIISYAGKCPAWLFWGSSVAAVERRRDAGACIINNEMIWTLTLAKSLSQIRNGVEVETRESQRVAAATARLTQLFQLSDFCWCCCCCFCCIYCRMVGLMSVCPFVCLSVCLSGLVLRLSWSPLMIYAGARLPLPACLPG